jgi:CubicO group peptidase (beta-lactamase class C family)
VQTYRNQLDSCNVSSIHALIFTLFGALPLRTQSPKQPPIRRLDGSYISDAAASTLAERVLKENKVTGAQIALINDGRLVWSAAYGLRDREHNLPMQMTTTTWAASITKSVFATYVTQLAERGQFQIDQPIVRLLPRPLDTYPEYRDTAAELVRDPRFATITPNMLLSHSSGLANFASLEPDKKMHLHFTPGSRFAYSGEGLNLVQFVLEQRIQKPLEEQLQDAFFTALNMTQTSLVWQERFSDNVADRYDDTEKFISHTRRDHARAAGSMTTSVEDLARFTTRLLNDEDNIRRILKPVTLKTMLMPVITIDAAHQFPTFDQTKGDEGPAIGLAYSLGWGLLTKTKYGPAFFKEGHGDAAQTYMICFTKHRDCMIILTNSDNGELAFKPLLEGIFGDTVTPWEWEGYTREGVRASRTKP